MRKALGLLAHYTQTYGQGKCVQFEQAVNQNQTPARVA